MCLYKKKKRETGSQPGLPGSPGFRVDPPGRPGFTGPTLERVFSSTRTGPRPGSTRRAGPGFKTLSMSLELASKSNVFILTMQKSMKRPYYPYIQGKVLLEKKNNNFIVVFQKSRAIIFWHY